MRFDLLFRKDKPFDVVGMGLNSVDFIGLAPEFPTINSKMKLLQFSKQGGGQVATAMVALARWGVKTKYIGKVGGDELGSFSLDTIREEGVDISSVTIELHANNQFSMILVDGVSGERTILWDRDERLMYREGELKKKDICSGKILHMDGHDIRAAIRSAQWAKKEGIPTVIDIDKVEPLTGKLIGQIDFVVTSSRFPTLMTGISDRERALIELQKQTSGFLCSTLGHEGTMALVNGEILYVREFKIKAVDTTGAGDVFHAGFIYGLLQNWKVEEILSFANAVAALKCLDLGGRRGIPTLEEIQRLFNQSGSSPTKFIQQPFLKVH
ncbi:MAG: PfkB family carbohydrate kinase [Thermodesulfobacteriota bacterium]|nr:PfkB family carbohydrate kinase [Thermodesulfobacteriota bacterium]